MEAVGLRTYIWNNNAKSVLLLAMFPVLLTAIAYALTVLWLSGQGERAQLYALERAVGYLPVSASIAFAVAAAWFAVAWVGHQTIINFSVGSREVKRTDDPALYNLLENLCISRGLHMPRLRVIETGARNAFASGLNEKTETITVTRGLLDALEPAEVEAVLGHELSHIRHRDVRLLVIAAVFVGIISFVGEMFFRGVLRGGVRRSGRSRRGGEVNAGALVLVSVLIIMVAYGLAIVLRFALSRRREYLADAGSVELTRNPDAMIGALRKISGHAHVGRAPEEVREMFLDNPRTGFAGLFATHPPIEKRIEALIAYAGGREG